MEMQEEKPSLFNGEILMQAIKVGSPTTVKRLLNGVEGVSPAVVPDFPHFETAIERGYVDLAAKILEKIPKKTDSEEERQKYKKANELLQHLRGISRALPHSSESLTSEKATVQERASLLGDDIGVSSASDTDASKPSWPEKAATFVMSIGYFLSNFFHSIYLFCTRSTPTITVNALPPVPLHGRFSPSLGAAEAYEKTKLVFPTATGTRSFGEADGSGKVRSEYQKNSISVDEQDHSSRSNSPSSDS